MRRKRTRQRLEPQYERGTISVNPKGFGFVQLENGSEIFIPEKRTGTAMHNDYVLVKIRPGKRWRRNKEGAVIKVLERKTKELAGFFNGTYVVPRDLRNQFWFFVSRENNKNAKPGDMVLARIISYPGPSGQAEAEIIEVLGHGLNPQIESKIILSQYGFREQFPSSIEKDLLLIPDRVSEADFTNRRDLTDIPFITIDPEDAKDFDDAVFVQKSGDCFKLYVAIADVSHYVHPGTELDLEAYQRATSVYFPDRAIPMLPETISAGIASLKPDEQRLAMISELEFDHKGTRIRADFYPAIIRSRFRMNYDEVQKILDGTSAELMKKYESVLDHILIMAELARALYQRRRRRGGLDFDLPEPKVKLDENRNPVDIYSYPRFFSHRMIEEFMLGANQAVAEFLTQKKLSFPYRIHEQPEMKKVSELDSFLSALGVPLLAKGKSPEQIHPRDFQKLFDATSHLPLSSLISYLALRSMPQAKYSPENKGHFGLALSHYCHFTSPIRRYPDLITHRVLKTALGISDSIKPHAPEPLKQACEHCSERERASISAERDMVKVYQAILFSEYLSKEFQGLVSGLTEFGIFVEIERPLAEGFIPATTIPGYALNEKLHTAFVKSPRMEIHLGDQVLVQVESVNIELREINLRLIGILKSVINYPVSVLSRDEKYKTRKKSRYKNRRALYKHS